MSSTSRMGLALMILVLGFSGAVYGDALHGFCYAPTPACADNGTNTPTSTDPPNFGFATSNAIGSGEYFVDILIPNNALNASSLNLSISGTQGGLLNNMAIGPDPATLVSGTAWTSGDLDDYLVAAFDGATPNNPIGAYLPSTQALDAGATGFFVYQADLGTQQLQPQANQLNGPLLVLSGAVPTGSYAVGFINIDDVIATANSGAIFETGTAPPVPEPSYTLLLGAGLVLVGFARKTVDKLRA